MTDFLLEVYLKVHKLVREDYVLKEKLNKFLHLKYCPFHRIEIQDNQNHHIILAYFSKIRNNLERNNSLKKIISHSTGVIAICVTLYRIKIS